MKYNTNTSALYMFYIFASFMANTQYLNEKQLFK